MFSSMWGSRLIPGVVFAAVALSPRAATAQIDFTMGIYAYDDPNGVIWSCPAVQSALARRMSAALDQEIEVEILLEEDYDRGVIELTEGIIDVARFPNVDNYWVIHPGLEVAVADAWHDAMVELRLEEIVPQILSDSGMVDVTRAAELITDATVAAVEDRFGSCVEVVQRLGQSKHPHRERLFAQLPVVVYGANKAVLTALAAAHRSKDTEQLNKLPATAAGENAGPEACGCP